MVQCVHSIPWIPVRTRGPCILGYFDSLCESLNEEGPGQTASVHFPNLLPFSYCNRQEPNAACKKGDTNRIKSLKNESLTPAMNCFSSSSFTFCVIASGVKRVI